MRFVRWNCLYYHGEKASIPALFEVASQYGCFWSTCSCNTISVSAKDFLWALPVKDEERRFHLGKKKWAMRHLPLWSFRALLLSGVRQHLCLGGAALPFFKSSLPQAAHNFRYKPRTRILEAMRKQKWESALCSNPSTTSLNSSFTHLWSLTCLLYFWQIQHIGIFAEITVELNTEVRLSRNSYFGSPRRYTYIIHFCI